MAFLAYGGVNNFLGSASNLKYVVASHGDTSDSVSIVQVIDIAGVSLHIYLSKSLSTSRYALVFRQHFLHRHDLPFGKNPRQ
jgi:hypothetical protein